jgi:hypothetical protein
MMSDVLFLLEGHSGKQKASCPMSESGRKSMNSGSLRHLLGTATAPQRHLHRMRFVRIRGSIETRRERMGGVSENGTRNNQGELADSGFARTKKAR